MPRALQKGHRIKVRELARPPAKAPRDCITLQPRARLVRKLKPGAGSEFIRFTQKISDRARTKFQVKSGKVQPSAPFCKAAASRLPRLPSDPSLPHSDVTIYSSLAPTVSPQDGQGEEQKQCLCSPDQAPAGLSVAMATGA